MKLALAEGYMAVEKAAAKERQRKAGGSKKQRESPGQTASATVAEAVAPARDLAAERVGWSVADALQSGEADLERWATEAEDAAP